MDTGKKMTYLIKILYLEDDPHLGEITASVLQKESFEVDWVRDGKQALKKIHTEHYDICIVDIMLPKLDGYSFVQALREKNQTMPVIFLSARVMTADVLKGFEIGGNDYMRKPFSVEELIVRIKRLLYHQIVLTEKSDILVIGKYTFNIKTMELIIDSNRIQLTDRLGEILKRLLTSNNYILDRKKTLLELWGDDSFFNGRSLDVFISRLRKLLSKDERIRIINIRGKGYRLLF